MLHSLVTVHVHFQGIHFFFALQSVFALFVSQLQGLEKPSAPAFKQSFHLLEVLMVLLLLKRPLCVAMHEAPLH